METTQTTTPAVTTTPTPATPPAATPTAPAGTLKYASLGKRIVAGLIDNVLAFLIIGFLVAMVTGGTTSDGFSLSGGPAFLAFFLILVYFVVAQGKSGTTLGKKLLGMKVVKEDGSPISYQDALIRTILNIVDGFAFGLVGIYFIAKSPIKQRIGDKVAHTVVIGK